MEIAFFMAADVAPEATQQAQTEVASDEFSLLLASMINTRLVADVAQSAHVQTVDGVEASDAENDEAGLEADTVKAETDAPSGPVLPVFVPVPVQKAEAPKACSNAPQPQALSVAPSAGALAPLPGAAMASPSEAEAKPLEGKAVDGTAAPADERPAKAGSAGARTGRMEIPAELLAGARADKDSGLKVELPEDATEALSRSGQPDAAASPASASLQIDEIIVAKAPAGPVGRMDTDYEAAAEASRQSVVDASPAAPSAFGATDDGGQGAFDERADAKAPAETGPTRNDGGLLTQGFDKVLESKAAPAETPAPRMSAITAEVHEKVVAGMKVSVGSEGGEVRMKLNPESLGEVRIKLSVSEGVVNAKITVENPEVKSVIESDSSFLRESLGAQGLTLDKCVVEVGRSFDARYNREDADRQPMYKDEHAPRRDREDDKGNGHWQRHYNGNNERAGKTGVDFFI